MKSKRNKSLLWISLLIGSVILTIYFSLYLFYYYIGIYCVQTSEVFGELIWCSAPAGTFFPLPLESGHEMAITSKISTIDYLLYGLIIATNLVYVLPLLFGGIGLLSGWKLNQKEI